MLRPECLEFQSHYERGRKARHLDECADCREFARFVDGLRDVGLTAPLADDLRARLRRLPAQDQGVPSFPRVPLLALPAALESRLRRIARQGLRESLPIWIRSPRYAIAASYLLTLLIGGTLGNPAAWAGEAGDRLYRVEEAWSSAHQTGRETWNGIGEKTAEHLSTTKNFLRASKSSLRARWIELVDSLNEQETTDGANDIENDGEASI